MKIKEQKPKKKSQALVKSTTLKPKPADSASIGEVMLCKMKGYCEWPCFVTHIEHGLISVEFFGDHTTHRAAIHNFYKFADCFDIILNNLKGRKNPLYRKSVREAEIVLGIPPHLSIVREFYE